MVEISNAGINNYVSQQAAQHTTQQTAQTVRSDDSQRTKEKAKSPAFQRGVIVQISKEARDLAKAASAEDNIQSALHSNRTHKHFQTAIVNAKQRQIELQKDADQSDAVSADRQNHEFMVKDVLAA